MCQRLTKQSSRQCSFLYPEWLDYVEKEVQVRPLAKKKKKKKALTVGQEEINNSSLLDNPLEVYFTNLEYTGVQLQQVLACQ